MIICQKCKIGYKSKSGALNCPNCGFIVDYLDNIYTFLSNDNDFCSEYYDKKGFDVLFQAEDSYFWFIERKRTILEAFTSYINCNDRILEVGAGTGNIAKMLIDNGYTDYSIGDVHREGMVYAKQYGIKSGYQFDLLNTPFENEFDVIAMFDVLEHIENDDLAIEKCHQMLKANGKVILTVPAHMWLWNDMDIAHCRRYELKQIKDKFVNKGFKVLMGKNFFLSILPLLYLRSLMSKTPRGVKVYSAGDNVEIKSNVIVNSILKNILAGERILLRKFSPHVGGSIILVVEKI